MIGLRKDWSKFPMEMLITTRSDKNRPIFICIVRDITFRKRHEEGMRTSLKEKDLLLEQIKIQVQNNLKIIYGLLDFQSGILPRGASLTADVSGQNMLDKISKLNKSFDLAGLPTKIDFTTYVKNLADRLVRSYGLDPVNFRLNVPSQNIFLSLRTAIPCGLILSDLFADSIRHSISSEAAAEITIRFDTNDKGETVIGISDKGMSLPYQNNTGSQTPQAHPLMRELIGKINGRITQETQNGSYTTLYFKDED